MKTRQILFSGPMVRAILEKRKTQTRRVVKPQPAPENGWDWRWPIPGKKVTPGSAICWADGHHPQGMEYYCPHGKPGDRLYVRETWRLEYPSGVYLYRANCLPSFENNHPWKPSIHMPRSASRIALKITEIRIERLQDISEEDAKAEGAFYWNHGKDQWGNQLPGWHMDARTCLKGSDYCLGTARYAFANLWNTINGPGAWDTNPWVWVVCFENISA